MTKDQFNAAIEAKGGDLREPRYEVDGEYGYDCFDTADGEELGFITYKGGEVVSYTVR